jgi:hypothetical protein
VDDGWGHELLTAKDAKITQSAPRWPKDREEKEKPPGMGRLSFISGMALRSAGLCGGFRGLEGLVVAASVD